MKKIIFLDFAETIGYRLLSDKKEDLKILAKLLGLETNQKNLLEVFKEESSKFSIYKTKPFLFRSLKKEIKYYQKFFLSILSKLNVKNGSSLSSDLATIKINHLRHDLFDDVIPFLRENKKRNNNKIFLITDGKPSRRITIDNLKITDLLDDIFISDEIGYLKNNILFYKEIEKIKNINFKENNVILFDDNINCLQTAKSLGFSTIHINRGGTGCTMKNSVNKLKISFI